MPLTKIPEKTELTVAFWEQSRLAVGENNVVRLYLACDGSGPMGHYDRIHAELSDGTFAIHPAHHFHGWTEKNQRSDGR